MFYIAHQKYITTSKKKNILIPAMGEIWLYILCGESTLYFIWSFRVLKNISYLKSWDWQVEVWRKHLLPYHLGQ